MPGMRVEDRVMDLSAEEGARVIALALLGEAEEAAEALAAGAGEEPLHDFRVAVRRLRSAIRTYRPWLRDGVKRRHEKRLRKIARSTNAARDAEVQLAWLSGKRDAFRSERKRPGWELVVARYQARTHGGPDAARIAARFQRTAGKLRGRLGTYERRVEDDAPGASFGGVLASLVRDQSAALAGRVQAIDGAADQEGVHRARIEGKRLRYLVEPLRGYERADASEAVARLKRLQDLLGDLHDAHVLGAELGEALVEAAADRARRLHAAASARGTEAGSIRGALQRSPRAGLLALVELVRERRDALFAELERAWRAGGMDALARDAEALAAALEARAGGKLEHERKFLLATLPPRAAEEEAIEIAQGWLPGARVRERVRRVRGSEGERFFRAVKRGTGAARLEAEEETSREVFEALWPLTEGRRIAKRRHKVREGALVWEIDAFTDRDLVVAEVELPARETDVQVPEWLRPLVVREVTGDPAYLDENLAATALPVPAAGAPHDGAGSPHDGASESASPA